jgi:uncharacterized protein YndB with AHSA1/START domain
METRNSAAASATDAENLELVITRVFDAPRGLVFKAWTDPEHLVRWWGPKGFTSTIMGKIELRPGAPYRIHMRGPDGDDHWSQGVYREIVEPERLVFAGYWADAEGKPKGRESTVTVTFEDLSGKTRLTLRQRVFESLTARDAHRGGWTSSFERLAKYLATV